MLHVANLGDWLREEEWHKGRMDSSFLERLLSCLLVRSNRPAGNRYIR